MWRLFTLFTVSDDDSCGEAAVTAGVKVTATVLVAAADEVLVTEEEVAAWPADERLEAGAEALTPPLRVVTTAILPAVHWRHWQRRSGTP